jgi:ABC-type Fe3+ transport system permease subunit
LWVAPASRAPKTLRVIGAVLILAAVLTPFFGVERSRDMLDWLLNQGPMFTRAWAGVAVGLGLFIVYATTGPR